MKDPIFCNIFIEEPRNAKENLNCKIWAFVLITNHVHLLIYPVNETYRISIILRHIKSKTLSRYRQAILDHTPNQFDAFCVVSKGRKVFRIRQPGGGFDRNVWSAKAIHCSINYIEYNPVRAGLATHPQEWLWSSANVKFKNSGLVSRLQCCSCANEIALTTT